MMIENEMEGHRRTKSRPSIEDALHLGNDYHAPWGRIDVTPWPIARMIGTFTATVVIYPPGTAITVRRVLGIRAFVRRWTGAGLMILILGYTFSAWGAWAAGGVLVGTVMLWIALGRVREAVKVERQARMVRVRVTKDRISEGESFSRIAGHLADLPNPVHDPVSYELGWARIYDLAAADRK